MTAHKLKPEELFESIERFIADSQKLLERGEITELTGLDARIEILCDEVAQLTTDDRIKYADRMQRLFDSLSVLGKNMEKARDMLGSEIRSLSGQQKAHMAYRSVATKKKEEE